jgi:hypothetical protein
MKARSVILAKGFAKRWDAYHIALKFFSSLGRVCEIFT